MTPQDAAGKRAARARMAATGEKYTRARRLTRRHPASDETEGESMSPAGGRELSAPGASLHRPPHGHTPDPADPEDPMTDAATAADDDISSDPGTGPPEIARLDLYRYATADDPVVRAQYLAIMRLFTETLLTDLAANEVAEQLTARGELVTAEDVEARCERLEAWGNLIRSVRDSRVATVADYLRSRSRYQVSKLGGRVHRQVDELLRATTGVRDVARELLGGMVDTLDRILDRIADASGAEPDAEAIAADVTTVFASQQLFTDSVADFYAYLNQVLSRYDLVGEEYAGFKELLLTYVDLITADVARHAPAVMGKLAVLERHLDALLAVLDTLPTLTNPDGSPAERSPGRARSDWEEFAAWYTGHAGRSGPAQLRAAAEQALAQLLANAKRMLAAAGTGISRRTDLLRLAGWLADAGPEEAHRLFAAAFGAYPARHLLLGPEEVTGRGPGAAVSWFDADPVAVPVSLRERGDRAARGRTSRVPDPGPEREMQAAEAEAEAARDRAAAADLIAAGTLNGARLTPAARQLVLDRLGEMFAIGQEVTEALTFADDDLGFVLRAEPAPGTATVVHAADGELHVHGLLLTVTALADADAATGSEG